MSEQPAKTIWPCLTYADADAAMKFLVDAFGFRETARYHDDDGRIVHAELLWPEGGGVMLGDQRDDNPGVGELPLGASSVYVVTDHPDELFERSTGAGAKPVRGLRDEDYGSRGFTVRDPEGNFWSFGTYPGHG